MKCVNPNNETVRILSVYSPYKKHLEKDKNGCEHIVKIEKKFGA